jgi:hypothetical protein
MWQVNTGVQILLVIPQSKLEFESVHIFVHLGNDLVFALKLFDGIIQMANRIHKERRILYPPFIFSTRLLLLQELFNRYKKIQNRPLLLFI